MLNMQTTDFEKQYTIDCQIVNKGTDAESVLSYILLGPLFAMPPPACRRLSMIHGKDHCEMPALGV